jgi:hypothetical protein
MTIAYRICWSIIGAAILFAMTARAEERCAAALEKYRHLEFGQVRFAIEEGCKHTFTQNEQFFIAGVAETLWRDCKLPRDPKDRAMVERFTEVSSLALFRNPNRPLHETLNEFSDGKAAFVAGTSMMEGIRCKGPEAALLSRGIVIYLKRTSGRSRFVAGCAEFYAERYTEKQCQCLAETLRTALPDVDERYFDRIIIKECIHEAPFIAAPLMWRCGVVNY